MALQTRVIKGKINSVKNIGKITKAMEMVAVSKMKKAVARALSTREYALRSLNLLANISKEQEVKHVLLKRGAGDRVLMVVVASNKGLAGGFNVTLFKAVTHFTIRVGGPGRIDFVTIGRNAERLARRLGSSVRGSFLAFSEGASVEDIGGLSKLILDEFKTGAYSRAFVAYNNYISALSFRPVVRELLPVNPSIVENALNDEATLEDIDRRSVSAGRALYVFEPDADEVAAEILPRLMEIELFHALLESFASEHSARMVAMKNATDNAGKLVDELTLSFNQARQAGITQEISEIAAGANALS